MTFSAEKFDLYMSIIYYYMSLYAMCCGRKTIGLCCELLSGPQAA